MLIHLYVYTQAIVSAVRERVDETAACVMRSLLRMAINLSQDKSLQTKSSPTVSIVSLYYCSYFILYY